MSIPARASGRRASASPSAPTGFVTVPQLGRVLLEDDVEVGANSTIDRGSTQDTVIGAGSRLDNLVQIGHNVRLGRCCIVVSQAGISGSTVLEDFVVVAAQAGLIGHLRIGAKARIGAQSGVMRDVDAGADVLGARRCRFASSSATSPCCASWPHAARPIVGKRERGHRTRRPSRTRRWISSGSCTRSRIATRC